MKLPPIKFNTKENTEKKKKKKSPAVDIWSVPVEVRLDKSEEKLKLLLDSLVRTGIPSDVLIFAKSKTSGATL